jgi:hypothetical protein
MLGQNEKNSKTDLLSENIKSHALARLEFPKLIITAFLPNDHRGRISIIGVTILVVVLLL